MRYRRRVLLTTTAIACLALAGCSAGGSARAGAEETAAHFARAIADDDGARACALLVRDAREAVETTTRARCEVGVLRLGLDDRQRSTGGSTSGTSGTSGTISARVYGRAAIVEQARDTVFLARSGDTWLVRAAGCTPVEDAPYDCTLDGS